MAVNVLKDSSIKARQYNEEKNYGRAFAHYLVVLELLNNCEARNEYKNEFIEVLQLWGSVLHERQQYEDLFKCYKLGLDYFPRNVEILNGFGVHALKLKHYNVAKSCFEKCLSCDSNFLPAEQNLQTTKYSLIERWHFIMLNDVERNKSYGQAIFIEIANGFTDVLDVGTGTGIFSLFASKCKQTKSVIGCDYSETMIKIANKVINVNNASNVRLIQKNSTELMILQDLKTRPTLLVTEILDSGIFGENILETLIHAWDHLLFPSPRSKIIPSGVAVYITGIQSSQLSRKVRLLPHNNNLLNLNNLCLTCSTFPYDTEDLNLLNKTHITETKLALFVDFNNIHQLKLLNNPENEASTIQINLKPVETGRIDAFVVWFTLYLNETITITNNPTSGLESCWQQAVFHLNHPLTVKSDQNDIKLKLTCYNGYANITCNETTPHTNLNNCFILPKPTILFLNDSLLLTCLEETIQSLISSHFKSINLNELTVLDLSPFPILALLLAQKGAQITYRSPNASTTQAITKLCEMNQIPQSNITIIPIEHFNNYPTTNKKFDIIYQNVISPSGLINEEEIIQHSKIMKLSVSERGIYLPENVHIFAELVQCDWLDKATKVDDKNVCGFKIAEFINEYKSTEQRDININKIPHIKLTEPVNVGVVAIDNSSELISQTHCTIIKNGRANAIFYWFQVEFIKGTNINTRRNESFVNNSSFMLNVPKSVCVGNQVCFVLKQHQGIIKINVV